ncbi:MAG: hypothetical protein ACRCU9_09380, partial [Iodobacter sp.]
MPYLLDLWALGQEERLALFKQIIHSHAAKEASPVAALLIADGNISQLRKHLCAIQVRRSIGQTAWLRMADPRVWVQLPRVLGLREILALFGPVRQWSVCLYGQWVITNPPALNMLEKSNTPPLALRWATLLRIGAVNRVLAQLELYSYKQALAYSGVIDELILQGQRKHNLIRTEELVSYACSGIHCGLDFDEHPVVLAAIAGLDRSEPGISIVDALAEISREQWEIIQRDIQSKMGATQLPSKANNGR